jgi:hypothetical protein
MILDFAQEQDAQKRKQYHILLAMLIAILNEGAEGEEQHLFRQFAEENHSLNKHEGNFDTCSNYKCSKAKSIITEHAKKELTITSDIAPILQKYRVRCGSRIIGTITARVEEVQEMSRIIRP